MEGPIPMDRREVHLQTAKVNIKNQPNLLFQGCPQASFGSRSKGTRTARTRKSKQTSKQATQGHATTKSLKENVFSDLKTGVRN